MPLLAIASDAGESHTVVFAGPSRFERARRPNTSQEAC